MTQRFDYGEFMRISHGLEDKHVLFNKFWSMVRPVFTEELPTAAVAFNKLGDCIDFFINPKFWNESNEERKLFIVSHECMHVVLSHGYRMNKVPQGEKRLANVAMDLVVNYLLVDRFGFDRDVVDPIKEYDDPKNPGQKIQGRQLCWLDTVLPEKNMEPDRAFEYYFNIIKQNATYVECDSFDEHGELGSFDCKEFENKLSKSLRQTSPEEKEQMKELLGKREEAPENKQAGTEKGGFWKQFTVERPTYKRKWEEIIKVWTKRALTSVEIEQWARKGRRMNDIHSDCMLPADMEIEETEKHKIDVFFFLDTSGSCAHLAERFLKAVRSIPPNRFNVKAFCFDTDTYPLDLKSGKLSGFGGTCFKTIDERVRKEIANGNVKKPTVFVVTDGYGTNVNPEDPKKWYWLLSENYRECIPSECNIYDLAKFE